LTSSFRDIFRPQLVLPQSSRGILQLQACVVVLQVCRVCRRFSALPTTGVKVGNRNAGGLGRQCSSPTAHSDGRLNPRLTTTKSTTDYVRISFHSVRISFPLPSEPSLAEIEITLHHRHPSSALSTPRPSPTTATPTPHGGSQPCQACCVLNRRPKFVETGDLSIRPTGTS
jgi:hypothetical protein